MSATEPRTGTIERKTAETHIVVSVNIDGTGKADIATGIGALDHFLTLWARHGLFDLEVAANGDLEVDGHHTVEDIGLCLGPRASAAHSASGAASGGRRTRSCQWTKRSPQRR